MSENSPEHRVAMETRGVMVSVSELLTLAKEPDTAELVRREKQDLADAHKQLGRLLEAM